MTGRRRRAGLLYGRVDNRAVRVYQAGWAAEVWFVPETVYVGLGSNVGDCAATLERAVAAIDEIPCTRVRARSSVYSTAPVGPVEQPDFLNMSVELETTLEPGELLAQLLRTEQTFGRVRSTRWGPRTLDLDILLWGGRAICTPELTVPHPEMLERGFVLAPLAEIAPKALHPTSGRAVEELYRQWKDVVGKPEQWVRIVAELAP